MLNPTWICQAKYFDLEYYSYILLDANKQYLLNLDNSLANFYEIIFHYLNLNTLITDKKIYDAQLKEIIDDPHLLRMIFEISSNSSSISSEILSFATSIFSNLILKYLDVQIKLLEQLTFEIPNKRVHLLKTIYIVHRTFNIVSVYQLNTKSKKQLGYSLTLLTSIGLNSVDESYDSILSDLNIPELNYSENTIFVNNILSDSNINDIFIIKDIILLNRLSKNKTDFNSNILFDYQRLLEKRKIIPFKLRV